MLSMSHSHTIPTGNNSEQVPLGMHVIVPVHCKKKVSDVPVPRGMAWDGNVANIFSGYLLYSAGSSSSWNKHSIIDTFLINSIKNIAALRQPPLSSTVIRLSVSLAVSHPNGKPAAQSGCAAVSQHNYPESAIQQPNIPPVGQITWHQARQLFTVSQHSIASPAVTQSSQLRNL